MIRIRNKHPSMMACVTSIGVDVSSIVSSPLVLSVCDHLQMIRIDTHSVSTLVVNLFFTRNEAMYLSVHDPMHSNSVT